MKSLSDGVDLIHIKGKEKAEYIRRFTPVPVVEFDEQPILQQSEPKCFYHMNSNCICSLKNVFICMKNEFVSFHSSFNKLSEHLNYDVFTKISTRCFILISDSSRHLVSINAGMTYSLVNR